MSRCRKQKNHLSLQVPAIFVYNFISICVVCQTAMAMPTADFEARDIDERQFVVISEDVIPDVENTTQKVIRVNPLDLPPIRDDPTGSADSDLYKIQAIQSPLPRNYVNTKRIRRPRPPTPGEQNVAESNDSPIIRQAIAPPPESKLQKPKHQQALKKKQLHFLYNQETPDGRSVGKRMQVRVAPGAYPVYYAVSKSNGRFGKYPIKGFSNQQEFMKYLIKSKLDPIPLAQRIES